MEKYKKSEKIPVEEDKIEQFIIDDESTLSPPPPPPPAPQQPVEENGVEENKMEENKAGENNVEENDTGTGLQGMMSGSVAVDKNFRIQVNTKNIFESIFDSTLDSKIRIAMLEEFYIENIDRTLEIVHRLSGMYQFGGAANMEKFLHDICNYTSIESQYKLQIVESLIDYEEFIDETTMSQQTVEHIKQSNREKRDRAYATLFKIATKFDKSVSTTTKVQKAKILMKQPEYKERSYDVWYSILDNQDVQCNFRYKTLLSLESHVKENILKILKLNFKPAPELTSSDEDEYNRRRLIFVNTLYSYFKHEIKKSYPTFNAERNYENSKFWVTFIEGLEYTNLRMFYSSKDGYNQDLWKLYWWELLENSLEHFFFNKENSVQYRILAAQYLIISLKREDEYIQNELLEIAEDNEAVPYNMRADAADVLLKGSEYHKEYARRLLRDLGGYAAKTVYENAQNVHTDELDASAKEILEYFSYIDISSPDSKWNNVNYEYFVEKIHKYLKTIDDSDLKEFSGFKNLSNPRYDTSNILENARIAMESKDMLVFVGKENFVEADFEDPTKPSTVNYMVLNYPGAEKNPLTFYMHGKEVVKLRGMSFREGVQSMLNIERKEKIDAALERIENDRGLYSIYSMSLNNIAIRLWVYIQEHDHTDELMKRYIEELIEMSGTCSSGYTNRLANVPSGFGQFSLRMSWDDQISANFQGRLNARARKLTDFNSEYYQNPDHITEITNLWLKDSDQSDIYTPIFQRLTMYSKDKAVDFARQTLMSLEQRENKQIENVHYKDIVLDYLSTDKSKKIETVCEYFTEKVLSEMTEPDPSSRMCYSLFFRSYLSEIREELYSEFKDYISDEKFDMGMRIALEKYDGY